MSRRAKRREENARHGAGRPRGRRSLALRFLIVFLALLVGFQVAFDVWFDESSLFTTYLHWNAAGGAAILRWLGEGTSAVGDTIQSAHGVLAIKRGCDAIQPCAIFAAGVLAYPAPLGAKTLGVLVGCTLLLAINLLRVVSLYFIQIHHPDVFLVAHEGVWPAAFILLALILWLLWAVRLPR